MSTLSQYDGWTVEGVVARNSHELTAMHLLQAREHIVAERARHERELADLRAYIDDADLTALATAFATDCDHCEEGS